MTTHWHPLLRLLRWLCKQSGETTAQQAFRTVSWYASFVEGIYLSRKYFKGTMPPGPLTDDELRRITPPTLVLVGEQEHLYHPLAAVARARHLIPGLVSADLIADAGHTLMQEQPKVAAARILAFLSTPQAESA